MTNVNEENGLRHNSAMGGSLWAIHFACKTHI
jgi:hypothetical protein